MTVTADPTLAGVAVYFIFGDPGALAAAAMSNTTTMTLSTMAVGPGP